MVSRAGSCCMRESYFWKYYFNSISLSHIYLPKAAIPRMSGWSRPSSFVSRTCRCRYMIRTTGSVPARDTLSSAVNNSVSVRGGTPYSPTMTWFCLYQAFKYFLLAYVLCPRKNWWNTFTGSSCCSNLIPKYMVILVRPGVAMVGAHNLRRQEVSSTARCRNIIFWIFGVCVRSPQTSGGDSCSKTYASQRRFIRLVPKSLAIPLV